MPEVTLKTPHTHAGQQHAAGAVIDVTEPEAAWLATHGVIEAPPASRVGSGGKSTTTGSEVKQ